MSNFNSYLIGKNFIIQVLPEYLCDKFLDYSLRSTNGKVKIRPEIVCVGRIFAWNVEIYMDYGNGRYRPFREGFI